MKNISIMDNSGQESGMAQIRLDPHQLNQLMSGSGLQLSLSQVTKSQSEPAQLKLGKCKVRRRQTPALDSE